MAWDGARVAAFGTVVLRMGYAVRVSFKVFVKCLRVRFLSGFKKGLEAGTSTYEKRTTTSAWITLFISV